MCITRRPSRVLTCLPHFEHKLLLYNTLDHFIGGLRVYLHGGVLIGPRPHGGLRVRHIPNDDACSSSRTTSVRWYCRLAKAAAVTSQHKSNAEDAIYRRASHGVRDAMRRWQWGSGCPQLESPQEKQNQGKSDPCRMERNSNKC